MSVMQNSFYVHTKYENMGEIYLYPIWEFFKEGVIRFIAIYNLNLNIEKGC